MKSLLNFDRKLTDDEYNWMMEGRAKVGLCDGLLNSEDFQYLSTLFSKLPDSSKLVVSTLDRSTSFLDHLSRAIIGQINPFVISLISQEKVDFIISHVDNARTLVTL
jgi:hypothetical protein